MADNTRLVPFAATTVSGITIKSDGSINGVKGIAQTINGSGITLKQGTVVNPPQTIADFFSNMINFVKNNWKLAAIGAVAILVLIRD